MRLKDDDRPAPAGAVLRRGERCKDLGRMVAVIVDDRNAVCRPFELKTAIRVFESRKSFGDRSEFNIELKADRGRSESVVYIVLSRDGKVYLAEYLADAPDFECRAEGFVVTDPVA